MKKTIIIILLILIVSTLSVEGALSSLKKSITFVGSQNRIGFSQSGNSRFEGQGNCIQTCQKIYVDCLQSCQKVDKKGRLKGQLCPKSQCRGASNKTARCKRECKKPAVNIITGPTPGLSVSSGGLSGGATPPGSQ